MQRELAFFLDFLQKEKGIVVDDSLAKEFSLRSGLGIVVVRAWLFPQRDQESQEDKEKEVFCGCGHA